MTLLASFNRMKLRLKVWRRMKFQPVETLAAGAALGESFNRMKLRAEGGALDESFNQLKLWLKAWGRMKVSTG